MADECNIKKGLWVFFEHSIPFTPIECLLSVQHVHTPSRGRKCWRYCCALPQGTECAPMREEKLAIHTADLCKGGKNLAIHTAIQNLCENDRCAVGRHSHYAHQCAQVTELVFQLVHCILIYKRYLSSVVLPMALWCSRSIKRTA